jgi:catechol 2,3-dioxygenase-like lactoylglutathione lyase family enzyme
MSKPSEGASGPPGWGRLMPLFVVADVDRAHRIYADLLGFREGTPGPVALHGGRMTILEHERSPVCFATAGAARVDLEHAEHILYAHVPDAPAHRESLESRAALLAGDRGGDTLVVGPLHCVSWGRYFDVEPPLGPRVRFFELAATPTAP